MRGKFVTQKSDRPFSCLSDDQIHEQNNRKVKSEGGAVSLLSSPAALLKWMVSGPEIARVVVEFEEQTGIVTDDEEENHHEDTKSFHIHFQRHVKNVVEAFEEYGNPFLEVDVPTSIISKVIMEIEGTDSVKRAARTGEAQFQMYVKERLEEGRASLHDVIQKKK